MVNAVTIAEEDNHFWLAEQATSLLRDVAANLRHHLPSVSKHKTLRAWAMSKRDSDNPATQREAETTLAILDFLKED